MVHAKIGVVACLVGVVGVSHQLACSTLVVYTLTGLVADQAGFRYTIHLFAWEMELEIELSRQPHLLICVLVGTGDKPNLTDQTFIYWST